MGEFLGGIFTAIGDLFDIGSISFWVISAVLFSALVWFTEDDKDFLAVISVVGFMWIVSSVNDFSLLANPIIWLEWLAIYMVIGSVWSFIKWFSFLHKAKDSLREIKAKHLKRYGTETVKDEHFKEFATRLYEEGYVSRFLSPDGYSGNKETVTSRGDVIPSVKNRKADLVRWIVWWPFSAFWTLLNDPIRRAAEAIVKVFKGTYTKMANAVFSNEI